MSSKSDELGRRLEEIKKSLRFDESVAENSVLLCDLSKEDIAEIDFGDLIRRVKKNINRKIGGKVV